MQIAMIVKIVLILHNQKNFFYLVCLGFIAVAFSFFSVLS